MDLSKLTLRKETRIQRSSKYKILKWMQDNPKAIRCTNISQLARTMARVPDLKLTVPAVCQQLNIMINNQMIYRYGKKKEANFRLNYLHKDMPQDLVESASEDDKATVKRALALLKQDESTYLDHAGAVVTPKQEEPTPEPVEPEPVETETPEHQVQEAEKTNTNIEIKRPKDGSPVVIQLSFTINIK